MIVPEFVIVLAPPLKVMLSRFTVSTMLAISKAPPLPIVSAPEPVLAPRFTVPALTFSFRAFAPLIVKKLPASLLKTLKFLIYPAVVTS